MSIEGGKSSAYCPDRLTFYFYCIFYLCTIATKASYTMSVLSVGCIYICFYKNYGPSLNFHTCHSAFIPDFQPIYK